MNFEKVLFAFFIVFALTLNFGFFVGDPDNINHHHAMELGGAILVNFIATIVKFGDRSQLGALLLATSLVADLQLLFAAGLWAWVAYVGDGNVVEVLPSIVSLSGGALLANLVSVTLLVAETVTIRR